jgi:[acyl-carrier-protein] S-malonyltransferase
MFELTANVPQAQPVFDAATRVLGSDPRQWVASAAPPQLYANIYAQMLCCTQALAAWAALDLGQHAYEEDIVLAGYSVGELASWGCAGLLGSTELLQLAMYRAHVMDAAAGLGTGLASVRGMSRSALETLCSTYDCEIAIILSSDSFIVGGPRSQLQLLSQQAPRLGAQRSSLLPVAIAAHTSALRTASESFEARLRAVCMATSTAPGVRLLSGLDGEQVANVDAGITKLAQQISQPVDWSACLTTCQEAGVTRVLELGPGRALAGMAREALPEVRCRSLDEFRTLEGVRDWLG